MMFNWLSRLELIADLCLSLQLNNSSSLHVLGTDPTNPYLRVVELLRPQLKVQRFIVVLHQRNSRRLSDLVLVIYYHRSISFLVFGV